MRWEETVGTANSVASKEQVVRLQSCSQSLENAKFKIVLIGVTFLRILTN